MGSRNSRKRRNIYPVESSVYTSTQVQYDAKEAAQKNYDAAEEKVKNLQAAYDAAKKVYEDAQATVSGNDAASVESLKQAYLDAEAALNAGKTEKESAKKALEEAQSDFAWAKQNILETKQAAIDSAQTSYDTALKNYEVTKLSVEQQLETYQATLNKTKGTASTASTELELQQLKDSLADYTIYAPCDGTITALNITEGSMVSNGASVATISNLSTMKVAINVDEYSILDTGAGSSVTIIIDSIGKSYEGTITRVSDIASLNNGVSYFEATVDFTADEYVKSGMSVEVRLTSTDKKGVLTISADALHYNDDNTAYVLVKNGDTQEMRNVEVGATDGNYVEILSGLEAEDGRDVYDSISVSGKNTTYFEKNDIVTLGRGLRQTDMAGDVYVCVIDENAAQTMFAGTNPIGQSVKIGGVSYTIVGLAGEDGNLMTAMMGGGGDGSIYIPFQNALALNGKSNVTSLEVYIEDTDKTDELIEEMELLLDNTFNNTDGAYSIMNMDSMLETMGTLEDMMTYLLAGIASIALLVGGIGIMNMMLVSVTERTKEIGLRKALGAEPALIQIQFLAESVVLSVMGGIIGILLGELISYVASILIGTDFVIEWSAVALGFGFALAIGVIFGWAPARRASMLNPIDALRSE